MNVSGRLDRLDAALGEDHAQPEPLDVEQDLKIVLDFATNAKTNRHLDEFAALMGGRPPARRPGAPELDARSARLASGGATRAAPAGARLADR